MESLVPGGRRRRWRLCPHGHESARDDLCDVCGTRTSAAILILPGCGCKESTTSPGQTRRSASLPVRDAGLPRRVSSATCAATASVPAGRLRRRSRRRSRPRPDRPGLAGPPESLFPPMSRPESVSSPLGRPRPAAPPWSRPELSFPPPAQVALPDQPDVTDLLAPLFSAGPADLHEPTAPPEPLEPSQPPIPAAPRVPPTSPMPMFTRVTWTVRVASDHAYYERMRVSEATSTGLPSSFPLTPPSSRSRSPATICGSAGEVRPAT